MLAMDVWCFSKSTIRVDLEKHQTRLHYWGNSLCNFEESPLQLWGILLYNKHLHGLSVSEVREQIQDKIIAVMNSDDPDQQAEFRRMFGNSTPTPEEFICTASRQLKF